VPGTKIAEAARRAQIVAAAYRVAAKRGLQAVTIRDVAKNAGVSVGLVIFHFRTKDRVVLALLDWVVANTVSLSVGPDVARVPDPLDRLVAILRQEMLRLVGEPGRNRLFFEFWSEGIWNRAVRVRMQRDLDRYREAIHPFVDAAIAAHAERFAGVDAAGLTTALVSFLKGCAVQSTIQPSLDVDALSRAMETLLLPPALHA
jgi:TetR/AcrR family transcriptional regulator, transcriptional repressor of bet genes